MATDVDLDVAANMAWTARWILTWMLTWHFFKITCGPFIVGPFDVSLVQLAY